MSKTCPSYECLPGSSLIGIAGADGLVRFVDPIRVNQDFVSTARSQKRQPEIRFRFSGRCLEKNCAQWHDNHCGLPEKVQSVEHRSLNTDKCPIKSTCRWHAQAGDRTCSACPGVVRGSNVNQAEMN